MKKVVASILVALAFLSPTAATPQSIGKFSAQEVGDCQYISIMQRRVADACTALINSKRASPSELVTILRNRASAYIGMGFHAGAEADLTRAFSLATSDQERARLWFVKGDLARGQGNCGQARAHYNKAIQLAPPNTPAQGRIGDLANDSRCKSLSAVAAAKQPEAQLFNWCFAGGLMSSIFRAGSAEGLAKWQIFLENQGISRSEGRCRTYPTAEAANAAKAKAVAFLSARGQQVNEVKLEGRR